MPAGASDAGDDDPSAIPLDELLPAAGPEVRLDETAGLLGVIVVTPVSDAEDIELPGVLKEVEEPDSAGLDETILGGVAG